MVIESISALCNNFLRIIGYGNSIRTILSSAILALVTFFYIYTTGSFFRVDIYVLLHRVSYNTYFDFFIINRYIDHLIIATGIIVWSAISLRGKSRIIITVGYGALTLLSLISGIGLLLDITAVISMPLVICILIYNRFASTKILEPYPTLSINYMALFVIATSIIGIILSIAVLFSVPVNQSLSIPNYSFEIFILFSSISPILMLLLVSCLPVKVLIREFKIAIGRVKKSSNFSIDFPDGTGIKRRTKIICLILVMLLSVILVIIPHYHIINKDNQPVGVDTHYYVGWVGALMHSSSPQDLLYQAFVAQNGGDRPITLIFLFALNKIVPSNLVDTIEYVPLVLAPALIFVVYLLTRELTSNDVTSLLASFLTAVSFQTLIGIYAGFYSNWFAIIIGYLSFVLLLKFLKKSSTLALIFYTVSIMLLVFAHVYTWSIFLIVTTIFLVVMLKLKSYDRRNIILLLSILFVSIIVDIAKVEILGSSSGIVKDVTIASGGGIGLKEFALRWSNLIDIVQNWYGTQFSNFIILILGAFWLWFSNFRKQVNIFIVIFLSIGFATLFFGNPLVQGRILYDIPFQIPAALSLSYIKKRSGGTLVFLAICALLIAISIRTVMNFHF